MKGIFLPLLLLGTLAQAHSSLECQSALIGPQGPSMIQIQAVRGGTYSLSYRENSAQALKVVSEKLICEFSTDMEMPFVSYCHDDQISVNIKQSIEGQMYDGVGVQKFNFVTITTRKGTQKSEFKTKTDMCTIRD